MLRQKIVIIVTLAVFMTTAVAVAQESSQNESKSTSFFGQLDQFGKKLLGGIIPQKSADDSRSQQVSNRNRYNRGAMQSDFRTGRQGSVLDVARKDKPAGRTISAADMHDVTGHVKAEKSYDDNVNRNHSRVSKRQPAQKRAVVVKKDKDDKDTAKSAPVPKRTLVADMSNEAPSLHERLMGIAESPFSYAAQPDSKPAKKKTASASVTIKSTDGKDSQSSRVSVASPAQSTKRSSNTTVKSKSRKDVAVVLGQKTPKSTPTTKGQPARKTIIAKTPDTPVKKPTLAKKSPTKRPAAKATVSGNVLLEAETERGNSEDILFERRSPMLAVRTVGPRHIIVDKESTYTVFLDNLGGAEAAEVVVAVELPIWADVLAARTSQGATRMMNTDKGYRHFDWQVGTVSAGSREQIELRIVPRESRPIDLGVSYSFKPAVSQTVIEVQEPKMQLRLVGPREVAFGKSRKYKLEITNTGNGPAQDVVITLMPVTTGAGLPSTHRLGAFPAGKKISLEIALTARQKEPLTINVDLHNEGKLCTRLNEKILVRKAELAIVADGPNMQYVGTVATYRIRLRNTGNAHAKNINVAAKIPAEAKYLASDNGGRLQKDEGQAVWSLASLQPGSEKILKLQCELVQAGFSRIDVETAADDQIQVSTATGTSVEAMADLTMEVVDPAGPVPVGDDAVYQIRIRNRGSKRADDVEAVGYFSQGIEPLAAEGAGYSLGPGQVLFRRLDSIEAGTEVILKITARADVPGNHMFRAEVHSKPLGTKLVSEETTHFFNGTLVADRPTVTRQTNVRRKLSPSDSGNTSKTTVLEDSRTADRRNYWSGATMQQSPVEVSSKDEQTPTIAPRYRSEFR